MADKTPIRGAYNASSALTGLAEYATSETVGVPFGGTGVVTIGSNALVTGNGTSAMTSEGNLTFDGTILKSTGDLCATVKVVAPALCIGSEYVLPTADGSAGQLMCTDGSGALAFATASGGVALAGSTNNTIATVTGADALAGEANLTFDGSTLQVLGTAGVGIARTEGTLHVHTASSGAGATPSTSADDLVIENDGYTGMTILSPNDGYGQIYFGDVGANQQGRIQYNHGTDSLNFATAATERMRIDSNGYVGIDQATPATYASKVSALVIGGVSASDNNSEIVMLSKTTGNSQLTFIDSATTTPVGRVQYNFNADHMNFMIAGTNRVLFDMQGATPAIQIGATRDGNSSNVGAMLFGNGQIYGTADGNPIFYLNRLTSTGTVASFKYASSIVGTISVAASSTAYNTSSDYRLKENIVVLTGATTRVAQLQPHRFNFIVDADTTVDGFVAHEVADIVPEAITGTKDEMRDVENVIVDADGNIIVENKTEAEWVAGKEPTLVSEATDEEVAVYADPIYAADTAWHSTLTVPEYQGIDQSKLVPLLTAAIQELTARITALESA